MKKRSCLHSVSVKGILGYISAFILFYLFAKASLWGISPFGIGLFVGLVYCRKNLLILTPLLLGASLLANFSWQTAVACLSIAVVLFLAYVIHKLVGKSVKLHLLLIYTAIAQIPSLFIYGLGIAEVMKRVIIYSISLVFTFFSILSCKCILVKGMKYKPSTLESVALAFCLTAFSLGLYSTTFFKLSPFYIFSALSLAIFPYLFYERGVIIAFITATAPCLYDFNTGYLLFALVATLSSLAIRNKWISSALNVCYFAVSVFLFELVDGFYPYNAILFVIGALIFPLLPQRLLDTTFAFIGVNRGFAIRTLVNRNRLDIYNRLKGMSEVLTDIKGVLMCDEEELPPIKENKNFLASKLAKSICTDCGNRPLCERELGTATNYICHEFIANCLARGRCSILEVPSFLTDNCRRYTDMLSQCKQMIENYTIKKDLSDGVNAMKGVMVEQIEGLSGMLESFALELKQPLSFDQSKEKRLIELLSRVNVIASEVAIFDGDGLTHAIIVVREGDENKGVFTKTVSDYLGKMIKTGTEVRSAGTVSVSFVSAPGLDVIYGVSSLVKEGSEKSGDTYSAIRLSCDKLLFAVCDGMGSGSHAMKTSENALSLVESFYKAGIDEGKVLGLINKLLSVKDSEDFSALDMCVINLRSRTADFIKLGGIQSVIRHKKGMELIEGGALPIGILDTVKPFVCRKSISSGDMILLFSDGVGDSIGVDGVVRIAEQNPTSNPETLAELITEDVSYVGRKDDSTVLAIRVFERL